MPTFAEVRAKYPQYNDLSDDQLASALHKKFYSDMPEDQFRQKIGLGEATSAQRIAGAFDASKDVEQANLTTPWQGSILPFSRDRLGHYSNFDTNAGLIGDVKRLFNPPANPMGEGGSPTPEAVAWANNAAALATPINPAVRAGDLAIPAARQVLEKRYEMAAPPKAGAPMQMQQVEQATYEPLRNTSAVPPPKAPVPTQDELAAAGGAGYQQAFGMGVDFRPDVISQFAQEGRVHLDKRYFSEKSAPNTYAVLESLKGSNGVVQLSDLNDAYTALRDGATSDRDRKAARPIMEAILGLMEDPPASALMAGAAPPERAAQAGSILKDARANWAARERSKEIIGRKTSGERRAKASNSGFNIGNTLRQRVASLLDQIDKGQVHGFSAQEVKMLNEFAAGTPTRNSIRFVSSVFGGGGGLGALAATGLGGAWMGSPAALALPAAGVGSRMLQNSMEKRALGKVDESVRMRSPLYGSRLGKTTMQPNSTAAQQALLRALMLYGPGSYGPPPRNGGGGF